MILNIALGVALGLLIFANLRGLIGIGLFVAACVLSMILLGATGWLLYEGFDVTQRTLPALRFHGEAAELANLVGGVLSNLVLAGACGHVLKQRSNLSTRDAAIFGVVYYVLFIFSVFAVPISIYTFANGRTSYGALYVLAIAGVWVFSIRQCMLRNRMCPATPRSQD